MSTIATVRSSYEDVHENLRRVLSLGDIPPIPDNEPIVIKMNLCGARTPETGAITHPLFLEAVLRYLREISASSKIYVVESDATTAQPDLFFKWFGFLPVLKRWNVTYVNLSHQEVVTRRIDGRYFKEIPIPKIFENAYFITLPKLKTNLLTGMTCCLKNQFGCLSTTKKVMYHPYIDDVIVDVNLALHPDLCIVDGIIAMGGELGPGLGTPIPLNTIICGKDPVAVDSFCARLIGFNPRSIGYIRKAAHSGVGSIKHTLRGDDISGANFEINKTKMRLLKFGSFLRRRFQGK